MAPHVHQIQPNKVLVLPVEVAVLASGQGLPLRAKVVAA
jgi:hypothetical protein